MKKPTTITLKQKFEVGARLKECLIARDDGMFDYKPGFTDDYIAVEFGIPKHLVTSVRVRAFGKLASATGGHGANPSANMKKRMRDVEMFLNKQFPGWNKVTL